MSHEKSKCSQNIDIWSLAASLSCRAAIRSATENRANNHKLLGRDVCRQSRRTARVCHEKSTLLPHDSRDVARMADEANEAASIANAPYTVTESVGDLYRPGATTPTQSSCLTEAREALDNPHHPFFARSNFGDVFKFTDDDQSTTSLGIRVFVTGLHRLVARCVANNATICITEVMRSLNMSFPSVYCARRLNVIIQPHQRFAYELLKWEELLRTAQYLMQQMLALDNQALIQYTIAAYGGRSVFNISNITDWDHAPDTQQKKLQERLLAIGKHSRDDDDDEIRGHTQRDDGIWRSARIKTERARIILQGRQKYLLACFKQEHTAEDNSVSDSVLLEAKAAFRYDIGKNLTQKFERRSFKGMNALNV
ncbi:hypothetical protein EV127DRAFT_403753 [Xylaria flabelliformis]|nr:hypothetical protein EV127DRAFT_403753 [Xylaria flabelliformis]